MARARSIHPLDGGYNGYIETLDRIREYVEEQPRTKEGVKSWYVLTLGTPRSTTDTYINSLFRCGLLNERGGQVSCTFPRRKDKALRIVQIIDENVVFVLDMLREASDGASEASLHSVGKRKYGLGAKSYHNQIQWRRGWLESTGMLKVGKDGLLRPTRAGRKMLALTNSPGLSESRKVNRAEFGGKGEGPQHKALKEYVCKNCDRILSKATGRRVATKKQEMEHRLPSGDSVDVTAWDQETVWHVEVKSLVSEPQDIERGIYQCIKYAAVGKAQEKLVPKGKHRKAKAILVVESDLSARVASMAHALNVAVFKLTPAMQHALRGIRG